MPWLILKKHKHQFFSAKRSIAVFLNKNLNGL